MPISLARRDVMLLNRSRALATMQSCGLDALVATSPVNITYFTDYYFWIDSLMKEYMGAPGTSSNLPQAYAVLPAASEPALIVNPLLAINAADLWVKDLITFAHAGWDTSQTPQADPDECMQRFLDAE